MAKGMSVTIERNTFGRRRNDLERDSADQAQKTGLLVIAGAAPLTPIDTGRLVGSPTVRPGDTPTSIDVVWDPNYAAIQEDIHRFAEQAAEQAAPVFFAGMTEAVNG